MSEAILTNFEALPVTNSYDQILNMNGEVVSTINHPRRFEYILTYVSSEPMNHSDFPEYIGTNSSAAQGSIKKTEYLHMEKID